MTAELAAQEGLLNPCAIYVCASFDCDAFELLAPLGVRVVGVPLILTLDSRHNILNTCHVHQFSAGLQGVVVYLTANMGPVDLVRRKKKEKRRKI